MITSEQAVGARYPLSPKTRPSSVYLSIQTKKMQKSVRWSTITVYEFGVGIGGSAVPKRGGPAIGLAKKPAFVWSTTVDASLRKEDEASSSSSGCEGGSDDAERDIKSSNPPKQYRQRRRVRWLKPLERVSMLEKAGYSEKKIYRMLMESSQIAMSRRLCLRLPVEGDSPKRQQ